MKRSLLALCALVAFTGSLAQASQGRTSTFDALSDTNGGPSPSFFNGALTAASPTFDAPNGSSAGSAVQYYCAQQFTVDTTGSYVIETGSPNTTGTPSNALDTMLLLYANSFNPLAPAGSVGFNDDFTGTFTALPGPYAGTISATSTGFAGAQPGSRLAAAALTAGTNYFLVQTAFRSTDFVGTGTNGQASGPFYTGIGGPGNITLVGTGCAAGPVTHTVTSSVGTPSGTITPLGGQTVNDGATTAFTLTPASGFQIGSVGGTCGGSLAADVFTTAAVVADCTVIANFANAGFPPAEDFDEQTVPAIPSGWSTAASGIGVPWVTQNTTSFSAPNAAYAPEFPDVSDMTLDTPSFIPVADQLVSFVHEYNLEETYDGAVLEISINGGAFADIITAGGRFESGDYNNTISSSWGSPISGREAWSGASGGFVEATVRLPAAAVGQPTILRFRTADDSSVVATAPNGWWIDDIQLEVGLPILPPSATVTPSALSFSVAADATATDTLNIANAAGSDPLTFSIIARGTTFNGELRAHVSESSANSRLLRQAKLNGKGDPVVVHNQLQSSGVMGSAQPAPWLPQDVSGGTTFYQVDDGTYENSIGFGSSANNTETGAVWVNRFAATGALTIDSISIMWPTQAGGSLVGLQANIVAYYDADADGNPANAVRLGSDNLITIASLDSFLNYPTTFSVPAAGDVYVGFVDQWAIPGPYSPRQFPAAIDISSGSQGMSYVSGGAPTDLNNLGNNASTGTIDALSGGSLAGNWLIRATGTGGGAGGPCTGPIVTWLTASPSTGTVLGGADTDVTITVNPAAGSLAAGNYTAELCVATNDPTQAVISVPVSVEVTPGAPQACNGGADEIFCDGFDAGGGSAGTYTDRTDFLTHVAAGFFDNPFNDAVGGPSPALSYSQGGFAYTVDATTPDGLYNDPGLISTNLAADSIVVTFTGAPVTAVGGNFWATDIVVVPTGTEVVITLSDGTTESFTSTGPTDFRGFTTTTPITSISIDAPDGAGNFWPTMDNLIVGSAN